MKRHLRSIWVRNLVLLCIVTASGALVFSHLERRSDIKLADRLATSEAQTIGRLAEHAVREAMLSGERGTAREHLRLLSHTAFVERIALHPAANVAASLKEPWSTARNSVAHDLPTGGVTSMSAASPDRQIPHKESFGSVAARRLIIARGACLKCHASGLAGWLDLQIRLPYVEEFLEWRRLADVKFNFGLVAVIALCSFILMHILVLEPIRKVEKGVKAIADGELDTRVEVVRRDEIGELTESFNHMAEKLCEADRAKSEFLAAASHELRTPLTSILATSELLASHQVEEDQRERFLQMIVEEGESLSRLVDNMLDLSKLQYTGVELELATEDLNAVVKKAVKTIEPLATRKSIAIRLELEEDIPPVEMDSARVQQICWNLLNNAVKFTEPGGAITVTTAHRDEHVECSVTDTGIGIPAEKLARIFDKFWQSDEAQRAGMRGLGLGLALVKSFVELHDGELHVRSQLGKGSTFGFTLPTQRGELPTEPGLPEDTAGAEGEQKEKVEAAALFSRGH